MENNLHSFEEYIQKRFTKGEIQEISEQAEKEVKEMKEEQKDSDERGSDTAG